MGLWITKMWGTFADLAGITGDPWNILMIGLDNAGKTTIVYKLKLNETISSIPTIGFNVETVTPCKGITFTIWDVGGQEAIRRLWRHYFSTAKGIIYVVDSNDPTRFLEAADELKQVLDSNELPRHVPVLVLANKQDLPNACRVDEIVKRLDLHAFRNNKWHVQACNAITGDGLYEGFEKLSDLLKDYKKNHYDTRL